MEISNDFEVPVGVDVAWKMFQDVPSLVACMPGVELTDELDTGRYAGNMNVRLGPMRPSFAGEAQVHFDDATHTGTIVAKGKDRKGGSRADARVEFAVKPSDAGSTVSLVSTINMMGQLAQFGRTNLLADVSGQLISEFADCLASKATAPDQQTADSVVAAELRPFAQIIAVVTLRLRRAMRRLGEWLVAKAGDE